MVNYQNGKIYRIVCNVSGKQYIGSTISLLNVRLSQHKKAVKDGKNCSSKIVLENNDCNIILLEDYPCERKEQLLQRERFYIETIDCVNKKIPTRTQHEWYLDNKEVFAKRYQDNKDKLIEYQKVWNNENREKCVEYQKRYRLKNQKETDENIVLDIEEIYEDKL